jgi:hypothetical protein
MVSLLSPLLRFNDDHPEKFPSNSLSSSLLIPSTVCEGLDFVNELIEELLDALGIGSLLEGIEEAVRDAIDLPIDFSFDTPFNGLIELDLDTILPEFDLLLLDLRVDLMANLPNPIDDIHKAVLSELSKLNRDEPAKYETKTMLTHAESATWTCPSLFMPVVASATYYGPDCVDTLDGVWRIPCDGASNECTKNYLNPDSRLTCATQSLDSYTSPEPTPKLTLAPPQHTFSSVYLCVPPTELDSLGIMPILNNAGGGIKATLTADDEDIGPFAYSYEKICTNAGGSFSGTAPEIVILPITQAYLNRDLTITADRLSCSGDARSVYVEYRAHQSKQEERACLDFDGPLYTLDNTEGYGMEFLCLDTFDDYNLGPDGGLYPNDRGPAYCMHPDNMDNLACTSRGGYPFTTNAQCTLPTTDAQGANNLGTREINIKRERVWNHLQSTKQQ